MKMNWKTVGGIVLVMMIVLGARETRIWRKLAGPNPGVVSAQESRDPSHPVVSPDDTSYLAQALRKGVNYYPYAGKLVKAGEGERYPYATYKVGTPMFKIDPAWPRYFERPWVLGQVSGVSVDAQDHVWMIHRPKSLGTAESVGKAVLAVLNPPLADCCIPAPAVMEFDAEGNFMKGWGGPGPGYEWPDNEHALHVDYKGNVWVSGNNAKDNQILKFTKDGKFLMQIGHSGKSQGSLDTANLNKPTGIYVYPKTNEVFVADGYGNKRVIVFDADTGAFKRMWGAYGNKPGRFRQRGQAFGHDAF